MFRYLYKKYDNLSLKILIRRNMRSGNTNYYPLLED